MREERKLTDWQGEKLKVRLYGASHDDCIGMVLTGLKKGHAVDFDEINALLDMRRPSGELYATPRKEPDEYEFTGGVQNGFTDGNAVTVRIHNVAQKPADYEKMKGIMRPAHADYAAVAKFGTETDLRGGGIFSGRLTAPLCVAGGIAVGILKKAGINVYAYLSEVGGIEFGSYGDGINLPVDKTDAFAAADEKSKRLARDVFAECKKNGDSVGGIIECVATGVPAGIGDAQFGSLESRISALVFGIPAVKSVEFGLGKGFGRANGSGVRDELYYDNGSVRSKTNFNGGINGGIANGMPVCFRVTVKPTPSIAVPCGTVDVINKKDTRLVVTGRHDVCIAPRAVPAVKSVAAIALLDALSEE